MFSREEGLYKLKKVAKRAVIVLFTAILVFGVVLGALIFRLAH